VQGLCECLSGWHLSVQHAVLGHHLPHMRPLRRRDLSRHGRIADSLQGLHHDVLGR
jgi:hypothetical protein